MKPIMPPRRIETPLTQLSADTRRECAAAKLREFQGLRETVETPAPKSFAEAFAKAERITYTGEAARYLGEYYYRKTFTGD